MTFWEFLDKHTFFAGLVIFMILVSVPTSFTYVRRVRGIKKGGA